MPSSLARRRCGGAVEARRAAATRGRSWIALLVTVVLLGAAGFGLYQLGRHSRPAGRPPAAAPEAEKTYTCPMHPQIIRHEPGKCPICGMDLVLVEEPAGKTGGEESGIAGLGVVDIAPPKQQLMGVVTTSVRRQAVHRTVRAVGVVTADESRLTDVHTKVEGWIEKLYASQTGKMVRKGEPLLSIYSPELVSAQEEYLVALRSRERLANSPFPEVRRSGESLVAAARQRLRLWDIADGDVQRLEKTGEVRRSLTLWAPATGYIMEKEAVEGMRVMPEMTLFRLADLSRVWVEAEIYESDASLVSVGQNASLSLEARPGRLLRGRVSYVYPTVEEMTRTLKARLEFANPSLDLKPGMYANVEIEAPVGGDQLVIPEQAVVDTGTRKVVFVKEGEGRFAPREVTLGPRAAGYYPVLSGLGEGEQVVSSPNFLMDSESRFQAAAQAMKAGGGEHALQDPEGPLQGPRGAGHGQ